MRSSVLALSLAIVLFSAASSWSEVSLDLAGPPSGYWDNDGIPSVTTDAPITWTCHWQHDDECLMGHTNAFHVFLSDHPGGYPRDPIGTFQPLEVDILIDFTAWGDDGGFFFSPTNVDGFGTDTVGFGGFCLMMCFTRPFDMDVWTITTQIDGSYSGTDKYLCIDSGWYPPGGQWLWSTDNGGVQPYWGGPY